MCSSGIWHEIDDEVSVNNFVCLSIDWITFNQQLQYNFLIQAIAECAKSNHKRRLSRFWWAFDSLHHQCLYKYESLYDTYNVVLGRQVVERAKYLGRDMLWNSPKWHSPATFSLKDIYINLPGVFFVLVMAVMKINFFRSSDSHTTYNFDYQFLNSPW